MKKKKEKKSANFTDFLNTKNTLLLYPMIGISIVESKLFREPEKNKNKNKKKNKKKNVPLLNKDICYT